MKGCNSSSTKKFEIVIPIFFAVDDCLNFPHLAPSQARQTWWGAIKSWCCVEAVLWIQVFLLLKRFELWWSLKASSCFQNNLTLFIFSFILLCRQLHCKCDFSEFVKNKWVQKMIGNAFGHSPRKEFLNGPTFRAEKENHDYVSNCESHFRTKSAPMRGCWNGSGHPL